LSAKLSALLIFYPPDKPKFPQTNYQLYIFCFIKKINILVYSICMLKEEKKAREEQKRKIRKVSNEYTNN